MEATQWGALSLARVMAEAAQLVRLGPSAHPKALAGPWME